MDISKNLLNTKTISDVLSKKVIFHPFRNSNSFLFLFQTQKQNLCKHEVVGVTLRTWDVPTHFSTPGQEEPDEILEARSLARRLGIEHHVADVREEFRQVIVRYFIDEYMRGRTPNPCVLCNPMFKERVLCEWADRTGCTSIATGHYCRLTDKDGYRYIVTGDDAAKDQSYFLWKLPQTILRRMIFPLGGMTKADVRTYLAEKGFEAKARGGESMEICRTSTNVSVRAGLSTVKA